MDRIYLTIPNKCPVCNGDTKIITSENGVENLICTNPQCKGKLVNRIEHFCSRSHGLDIKGLSCKTIEKLINWGYINEITDIFALEKYKSNWQSKPGFGAASVTKILNAINAARESTSLDSFISALGIPLVGKAISKEIVKY